MFFFKKRGDFLQPYRLEICPDVRQRGHETVWGDGAAIALGALLTLQNKIR